MLEKRFIEFNPDDNDELREALKQALKNNDQIVETLTSILDQAASLLNSQRMLLELYTVVNDADSPDIPDDDIAELIENTYAVNTLTRRFLENHRASKAGLN